MKRKSAKSISNYVSLETGVLVTRAKAHVATEFAYPVLTQKGFAEADKIKTINYGAVFFTNEINDRFFTRRGDVIVRLTAPYGAKVIGPSGTGLLVPSSFMIVRVLEAEKLSASYLAYFLDRETRVQSEDVPDGAVLKPLTKDVLGRFEVTLPFETQERIAELWEFSRREQKILREIAEWKLRLSEAKIAELERKAKSDA